MGNLQRKLKRNCSRSFLANACVFHIVASYSRQEHICVAQIDVPFECRTQTALLMLRSPNDL